VRRKFLIVIFVLATLDHVRHPLPQALIRQLFVAE